MTDRPIIFSAPMAQALLAGRKTQTRRLLPAAHPRCPHHNHIRLDVLAPSENAVWYWDGAHDRVGASLPLRYAVGDRLYVREAWRTGLAYDDLAPRDMSGEEVIDYVAGSTTARWSIGRNRASMHMPRWASRMTLGVTEVRVQRLQEISEEDAVAEGACVPAVCEALNLCGGHDAGMCAVQCIEPLDLFESLWAEIHGPEAWAANPWVVAVTFTVDPRNIDAIAPPRDFRRRA